MLLIVTYDVSTVDKAGRRRLRRVADVCEDYGTRVQLSVFECRVGSKELLMLRDRLLSEVNLKEDSLRIYFVDEPVAEHIEHYGRKKPIVLTEPLIF